MKQNRGREFERLTHIFELLIQTGAKVEFDVRIPDRVAGNPRQVDVVVEFQTAHGPLKYGLECKDEARPVGSPTIEAVYQKGLDLRLTRMAVVSRNGFTAPALKKAEFLGVDTLTLEDVPETAWPEWMGTREFVVRELVWEPVAVNCVIPGEPTTVVAGVLNDEPIFLDPVGSEASLRNVVDSWLEAGGRAAVESQLGTDPITVNAEARFQPAPWSTTGRLGPGRRCHGVVMQLRFVQRDRAVPLRLKTYRDQLTGVDTLGFVSDPLEMNGRRVRMALTRRATGPTEGIIAMAMNPVE